MIFKGFQIFFCDLLRLESFVVASDLQQQDGRIELPGLGRGFTVGASCFHRGNWRSMRKFTSSNEHPMAEMMTRIMMCTELNT